MRRRNRVALIVLGLAGCALFGMAPLACGLDAVGAVPAADAGDGSVSNGADAARAPIIPCSSNADCPVPESDCVAATCDGVACVTKNVSAATPCATQGGRVCDGSGRCSACVVARDCPPSLTACKVDACTANACAGTNASPTTPCSDNGGRICDGNGTCVACNAPTDCPASTTVCKTNTCAGNACGVSFAAQGTPCSDGGGTVCDGIGACVAAHCTNGTKDQGETDVDCGGTCGATCKDSPVAQTCGGGTDCISGVCKSNLCQHPTCSDGVRNGNETDVDCGGAGFGGNAACPKCADRKECIKSKDCRSDSCFGSSPGICVSCADGVLDGTETDLDCGGAFCDAQGRTCGTGKVCTTGADCSTGYCPSGTCQLLPDGSACTSNAQCLHAECLPLAGGGKICCSTGCTDQGAATCGTDGRCLAGGGGCEKYPSGATCAGSACSGSTFTPNVCDGTGACLPGTSSPCANHLDCNSNGITCLKSCGTNDAAGDANCITGYWCNGVGPGSCQPPLASGATCDRNSQCVTSCKPAHNTCQ